MYIANAHKLIKTWTVSHRKKTIKITSEDRGSLTFGPYPFFCFKSGGENTLKNATTVQWWCAGSM